MCRGKNGRLPVPIAADPTEALVEDSVRTMPPFLERPEPTSDHCLARICYAQALGE